MENFSLPIHGDVYLLYTSVLSHGLAVYFLCTSQMASMEDIQRCILIVYIIGQSINNINCGVYCVYMNFMGPVKDIYLMYTSWLPFHNSNEYLFQCILCVYISNLRKTIKHIMSMQHTL